MQLFVCLMTEEELKRLNEALADDNSYSAVSFDYGSSDKTEDESTAAETHGKSNTEAFFNVFISEFLLILTVVFNFSVSCFIDKQSELMMWITACKKLSYMYCI